MQHLIWSQTEKRIARAAFDAALREELAELVAEFKRRAAAVTSAEEIWPIRDYLEQAAREIDTKYDYRYSELTFVFGRLLRERRIAEEQLAGLSEEKLQYIRRIAGL